MEPVNGDTFNQVHQEVHMFTETVIGFRNIHFEQMLDTFI